MVACNVDAVLWNEANVIVCSLNFASNFHSITDSPVECLYSGHKMEWTEFLTALYV